MLKANFSVLPHIHICSIEGECELRLIVGDWMFIGEIEL